MKRLTCLCICLMASLAKSQVHPIVIETDSLSISSETNPVVFYARGIKPNKEHTFKVFNNALIQPHTGANAEQTTPLFEKRLDYEAEPIHVPNTVFKDQGTTFMAVIYDELGQARDKLQFLISETPCSALSNLLPFGNRSCQLPLLKFLDLMRDTAPFVEADFRVGIYRPETKHNLIPDDSFRDANGFFWQNDQTLLITCSGNRAGLYRLDLVTQHTTLIRNSQRIRAPFSLHTGQLGYVKDTKQGADLYIDHKLVMNIPVPIHQWFALPDQQESLVGMNLSVKNARHVFYRLDLRSMDMELLGTQPFIYHEVLNLPRQHHSKAALNMALVEGELYSNILFFEEGRYTAPITDPEQLFTFLPGWNPSGSSLAYLIRSQDHR